MNAFYQVSYSDYQNNSMFFRNLSKIKIEKLVESVPATGSQQFLCLAW